MNIAFAGTAAILWLVQKSYYRYRNAQNIRRWSDLSEADREREFNEAEKKGNRSVTFHFTT